MKAIRVSRCSYCGHVAYPSVKNCPACGQGEGELVELGEGTLYTFTIVHVAAPGIQTPYALGYVDFPQDIRVFGRIEANGTIAIGMKVHLAPTSDGFTFKPIREDGESK